VKGKPGGKKKPAGVLTPLARVRKVKKENIDVQKKEKSLYDTVWHTSSNTGDSPTMSRIKAQTARAEFWADYFQLPKESATDFIY